MTVRVVKQLSPDVFCIGCGSTLSFDLSDLIPTTDISDENGVLNTFDENGVLDTFDAAGVKCPICHTVCVYKKAPKSLIARLHEKKNHGNAFLDKDFWENALVGKKIVQLVWERDRLVSFFLDSGHEMCIVPNNVPPFGTLAVKVSSDENSGREPE